MKKPLIEEPDIKLTAEERKELGELFPFEYQGGGYFRKKGVPLKVSAPILHGHQVVEFLFSQMKKG
jgi:hypothetical protein